MRGSSAIVTHAAFEYLADPQPLGPEPTLGPGNPHRYGTSEPGLVKKAKDALS